ncbi:MAG: dockerin type I repeat-containing protein [Chloroflexota bacterium]|nr:dockerin type I repeat-containing protein [Chloroflexota bacterium]
MVSWHVSLDLEGNDTLKVVSFPNRNMPFRESGHPDLVLNEWRRLSTDSIPPNREPGFFGFRNSYDSEQGILQYGVTLVGADGDSEKSAAVPLSSWEERLLGLFTMEGSAIGTVNLIPVTGNNAGSRIAVLDELGEVRVIDAAVQTPLAVVNVGPNAEKARIEGHVGSDVPRHDGESTPYRDPFQIEIWRRGAVPPWKGGQDQPLVTYFNIESDKTGSFSVSDISPQLIPSGIYDLRLKGESTLSAAQNGKNIDTSGESASELPYVVNADFGALPGGDLNGDNLINEADLLALKSVFGARSKSVDGGMAADLNRDGVIDGQDFSLMAVNYGRRGE